MLDSIHFLGEKYKMLEPLPRWLLMLETLKTMAVDVRDLS